MEHPEPIPLVVLQMIGQVPAPLVQRASRSSVPAVAGRSRLRLLTLIAALTGVLTVAVIFVTQQGGTPTSRSEPAAVVGPWHRVYLDTFSGTSLGSGWDAYRGPIPSTPGGRWEPSHVTVADGLLTLKTFKKAGVWTSGGVMNSQGTRSTYGKYEVRIRMDKANGVKYAALLWPASNKWPLDGEIDFAEDGGGDRIGTTGTLIYTVDGSTTSKVQRPLEVDLSQWHTVGVEWSPGQLVYTVDGAPWATVLDPHVPDKPMTLALQTEAGSCGQWMTCTDGTTPAQVDMQVDWVTLYRR